MKTKTKPAAAKPRKGKPDRPSAKPRNARTGKAPALTAEQKAGLDRVMNELDPPVVEVAVAEPDPEFTLNGDASVKPLSQVEAAVKVLSEAGRPMRVGELYSAMAERGYWRSLKGKTPANTLSTNLLREVAVKGAASRFRKTSEGWALNG